MNFGQHKPKIWLLQNAEFKAIMKKKLHYFKSFREVSQPIEYNLSINLKAGKPLNSRSDHHFLDFYFIFLNFGNVHQ